MSRNQVIFIRGGESFETKEQFYDYLRTVPLDPYSKRRNWRDWLEWSLSEDFDSLTPHMPNKQWADYEAWRIWFERHLEFIRNDNKLILIGQSLGGLFLAKYLSENEFPRVIDQLHLVCPVFDNEGMTDERTASFTLDPSLLSNVQRSAERIFLYHSTDDDLVPIAHAHKYLKHLERAEFLEFHDRGHFRQPAFMELLETVERHL